MGSKYYGYLVFKVVAKLKYLAAIIGGHVLAWLPPIVRYMTKQNSIWSKALKWNCVLSDKHIFQEITFIPEFPGSNFLPPTF